MNCKSVLCILQLFFLLVNATEKHLICKQVDDVFETHQTVRVKDPTLSNVQGRPGKRGERGRKGDPGGVGPVGRVGPRGIVDYKRVNDTITDKLHKAAVKTNSKIDAFEKIGNNLKKGMCRVEYESKCFWVIFSTVTFYQGQTLCQSFGAEAANIYNKDHYDMIMEYVRSVMPPSSAYIEPWLGMTIDISSLQLSLSSGRSAPYVLMYPSYPRATGGHSQINLQVPYDKNTATQNMWNYDPSQTRDGILCEIEM